MCVIFCSSVQSLVRLSFFSLARLCFALPCVTVPCLSLCSKNPSHTFRWRYWHSICGCICTVASGDRATATPSTMEMKVNIWRFALAHQSHSQQSVCACVYVTVVHGSMLFVYVFIVHNKMNLRYRHHSLCISKYRCTYGTTAIQLKSVEFCFHLGLNWNWTFSTAHIPDGYGLSIVCKCGEAGGDAMNTLQI